MSRAKIIGGSVAAVLAAAGSFAVINEGVVLRSYADPVWGWKVPTACAGDTGPHIRPGMTFTLDQCLEMLGTRHRATWARLEPCITRDITVDSAIAILSLADNVGVGPVCTSTMLRMHNEGMAPAQWCPQFERWVFVGGKDCRAEFSSCKGIVSRRKRERAVCEGNL